MNDSPTHQTLELSSVAAGVPDGATRRTLAPILLLALVLVPAAAFAVYAVASGGHASLTALVSDRIAPILQAKDGVSTPGKPQSDRVVAVVNGQAVNEAEVTAVGISNAVSRAQLVDDYVNKILMAQELENQPMSPDLAARIERSRREMLAATWAQTRSQQIQNSLTNQELQDVYAKEIKDSIFAHYKISFIRGSTVEEAQNQHAQWTSLKTDRGEEWLPTDAIPYQMGGLVATLKKGESTQSALSVRDGFLRLRVDDIQEGKKPSFDELKPRITEVLVNRKLQLALQELRGKADIRMK